MRICRFGDNRLGVVKGDRVHDVSDALQLLPPLTWPVPPGDHFFNHFETLRPRMAELAETVPGTPVGEVALLPKDGLQRVFGRGGGKPSEDTSRVTFFRQRPGKLEPRDPLHGQGISRRQLVVETRNDGLFITRIGRCPMLVNGVMMDRAAIHPGDTVMLRNELLLLCGLRPLMMMDLELEGGTSTEGEAEGEGQKRARYR